MAEVRGVDDRRPLNPQAYSIYGQAMGVIYCKNRQTGAFTASSATVVNSRRQLVGSGHFLGDDEKTGPRFTANQCVFRIYNSIQNKVFESKISSFEIFQQIATIVLEDEVPRDVMVHDPVRPLLLRADERFLKKGIELIAHHEDLDAKTTYTSGECELMPSLQRGAPFFSHLCDENGGASGGAFILVLGNQVSIVGVDVGEYSSVNFGQFLDEQSVRSLIENRP